MTRRSVIFALSLLAVAAAGAIMWSLRDGGRPTIGCLVFLTGPQAFFGQEIRNGVELAHAKLDGNRSTLVVEFADTRDNPRDATIALSRMIADRNVMAILVTGDVVSIALAGQVSQASIPTLATVAAAPDIAQQSTWMFRNWLSSARQAEIATRFAIAKLGHKRIAALRINNNYGVTWLETVQRTAVDAGAEIVKSDTFEVDARTVRPQLLTILQSKPDALLLGGFGPGYGRAIIEARELAPELPILTDATLSFPSVRAEVGKSAEGVYFSSPRFAADSPQGELQKAFVQEYSARYGTPPSAVAAFGYDSLMLLADAIHAKKEALTRASVRDALLQVRDHQGVIGPLSISAGRDVSFPLEFNVIRNGVTETLLVSSSTEAAH